MSGLGYLRRVPDLLDLIFNASKERKTPLLLRYDSYSSSKGQAYRESICGVEQRWAGKAPRGVVLLDFPLVRKFWIRSQDSIPSGNMGKCYRTQQSMRSPPSPFISTSTFPGNLFPISVHTAQYRIKARHDTFLTFLSITASIMLAGLLWEVDLTLKS